MDRNSMGLRDFPQARWRRAARGVLAALVCAPMALLTPAHAAKARHGAGFEASESRARPSPLEGVARESGSPSQADLFWLGERSDAVIRAQIRRAIALDRQRAPSLPAGMVRLYVEARASALIAGAAPIAETIAYLLDAPLDARGKPPRLKKRDVLLFARMVEGKPGQIRLAAPQGQLDHSDALEARVRAVMRALLSPDAPPVITGVSEALAVAGTLAGESETQIFLATQGDHPVSISVVRRPGQPPRWGVSWGEIIDQSAQVPRPGSLQWYRLACALPPQLPSSANLARDAAMRALAERDYRLVIDALGACERPLTAPRAAQAR